MLLRFSCLLLLVLANGRATLAGPLDGISNSCKGSFNAISIKECIPNQQSFNFIKSNLKQFSTDYTKMVERLKDGYFDKLQELLSRAGELDHNLVNNLRDVQESLSDIYQSYKGLSATYKKLQSNVDFLRNSQSALQSLSTKAIPMMAALKGSQLFNEALDHNKVTALLDQSALGTAVSGLTEQVGAIQAAQNLLEDKFPTCTDKKATTETGEEAASNLDGLANQLGISKESLTTKISSNNAYGSLLREIIASPVRGTASSLVAAKGSSIPTGAQGLVQKAIESLPTKSSGLSADEQKKQTEAIKALESYASNSDALGEQLGQHLSKITTLEGQTSLIQAGLRDGSINCFEGAKQLGELNSDINSFTKDYKSIIDSKDKFIADQVDTAKQKIINGVSPDIALSQMDTNTLNQLQSTNTNLTNAQNQLAALTGEMTALQNAFAGVNVDFDLLFEQLNGSLGAITNEVLQQLTALQFGLQPGQLESMMAGTVGQAVGVVQGGVAKCISPLYRCVTVLQLVPGPRDFLKEFFKAIGGSTLTGARVTVKTSAQVSHLMLRKISFLRKKKTSGKTISTAGVNPKIVNAVKKARKKIAENLKSDVNASTQNISGFQYDQMLIKAEQKLVEAETVARSLGVIK